MGKQVRFHVIETKKIEKNNKPAMAYQITKFFGILLLIWPTDNNKKWFRCILCEICWGLLMVNEFVLFCGVSIGFYNFYDDIPTFVTVIFILTELVVICEIIYTSIFYKVRRLNIKTLISVVESTVYNVNSKEERLFREYVKTSNLRRLLYFIVFMTLMIDYIYLHLFEPILILPKEVWHPFSIDPFNKKCLVLVQQLIYVIHIGSLIVSDNLMCMSIIAATVKLQILADKLKNVTNNFKLKKCIRKHQKIIWFINEINRTMRFMILKTVFTYAFYLICALLQLAHMHEKLNFILMGQFTMSIVITMYRLYYSAQCVDDLSTMSENLGYSTPWVEKSSQISKSMRIILIQRCQKPVGISVYGIMPHFNLKYYGNFLSFTFSCFLTFKAILQLKSGF